MTQSNEQPPKDLEKRCGTMNFHRGLLQVDADYAKARLRSDERHLQVKRGAASLQRTGITVIPIVIHVLWNTDSQNISDGQILSQIRVLNRDFRKVNSDLGSIPAPFAPFAADARIEFELATVDPNGAPTNGITRTKTTVDFFDEPQLVGEDKRIKVSPTGIEPWPNDRYLNIWVCQMGVGTQGTVGYSTLPGASAAVDGIVIRHNAFGTTGTAAIPFPPSGVNLGRTATHEIGHWLNLYHVWGNDETCSTDDQVDDTPLQAGPNMGGGPPFPHITCNNGPNGDMFMNYMDVTDDDSKFMFTHGQVERMQTCLESERRTLGVYEKFLPKFGYEAGIWRVDRHPRFLADLTGDRCADIVGFGDDGVWVALNTRNGSFLGPRLVIGNFGYEVGSWRVDRHPRFLADLTGDDRADIIGFGNAGVWVALSNGDGSFQDPQFVLPNFGYNAGSWRVDRHPRFLADLTAGRGADIVGFGNAGVWVALSNGDGSFQDGQFVVPNFGYNAGGWRVDRHPRFLADLTNDRRADIIGFGDAGVWVALSNGDGSFKDAQFILPNFGYNAGNWRVDRHPRFLADLTGDGCADIVGFGNAGVWVALNNGDGSFQDARLVLPNFGYNAGSWRVDRHPRFLADLTGDRCADIIGFGDAGVWVALNNGDGSFQDAQLVIPNFGYNAGGWRVDRHPRFLADLTGDDRADIAGFGNAGVWIALNNGNGAFPN